MTDRKRSSAFVFFASILVTGVAVGVEPPPSKENTDMDLYKRGLENLNSIVPSTEVMSSVGDLPSPLAEHFISFLYGEVYESISLSPKNR